MAHASPRDIPHGFLWSCVPPAIRSREMFNLENQVEQAGIPVIGRITQRTAFSSLYSLQTTLDELPPSEVSGLDKAKADAVRLTDAIDLFMKPDANPTPERTFEAPESVQAVSSPAPSLSDEATAAVAARNGYPNISPTAPPASIADHSGARRQRQPTGRDHQFNVRLRRETLDFIYAQANERNIPVAQVIEDIVEALKRQQGGR
jgi:hypothetical protein